MEKLLLAILLFVSPIAEPSDSATLQKLFDSRDVIELPSGVWNITTALVLGEGKRLTGSPGAVLFHASNIRQSAILTIGSNTIIEGLTFRSTNDQRYWYIPTLETLTSNVTHLIIRGGSKNITIRNCRFANAEFGITCSYIPGKPIDNIVIDNVTIDSSFMSMLITGADRVFVTNYRSDKRHITEPNQYIGHHSYFEGVKRLFIDNYHAIGGCCDGLKLRNTVLPNISSQISNVTIDSTGPLKIDYAGDVNMSNITFNGNYESLWPAGFKTLQVSNMIVYAIESTTAFTRVVTAGNNRLPQGEILKINGLTTTGAVSIELTKAKKVFLSNVVMIDPLDESFRVVPIKVPPIASDTGNTTHVIMIDNMYVFQDKEEAQNHFIEVRDNGNTNVTIKNSFFDFNGHQIDWFMKADRTSKLSFQSVDYNSVVDPTGYDKGQRAAFAIKR